MDRFRCGIHPGEVPFCAHGVRAIWQGSSQRLRLVPRRARGPPRRQGRALVPHCTVAGVMRPPTTAPPTDFFAELLARPSIRADTSQGRHIAKGAALHAAKRLRMSDDELRAGLSKLSNEACGRNIPTVLGQLRRSQPRFHSSKLRIPESWGSSYPCKDCGELKDCLLERKCSVRIHI